MVRFLLRHPWAWSWLYLAVLAAGLVCFLSRQPVIRTEIYPVQLPQAEEGVVNLAPVFRGGSVQVSSFDTNRLHHPLYAIDSRSRPTLLEKWATVQGDREPWIEVRLGRTANVSRVVLVLAGEYESDLLTMSDYTIQCLRGYDQPGQLVYEQGIHQNRESSPVHEIDCPRTDRVRVGFGVAPVNQALDVVRLYEIQVWGEVVDDVRS